MGRLHLRHGRPTGRSNPPVLGVVRQAAGREAPAAPASRGDAGAVTPEQKETRRRYYLTLKADVLEHYGTACACCGTTENLTIDHLPGSDRRYRERGTGMYLWLKRSGFPEGFQSLCKPCNSSKSDGDYCRMDHALREQH